MSLSRRLRGPGSVLPEGVLSRVRLEPGQVSQAGIRTAEVRFATPAERLTAVGFVGLDQSRRALVASDARGRLRVDRLHACSEGEAVRAGQPLAELYGYDVSQAIQVFLDAYRARRDGPDATDSQRTPLGDPEERVRLAVEGLKVLGVRQEQIDAIAGAEAPGGLLPLLAPIDGLILRKNAVRGQYVTEGEVLFEVADLGRVWVEARIFEEDLGRVEVGGPVEATVPTYPGVVFAGEVALIGPTLDPATRTAAVRFTIDNPGHRLRPRMFAQVTLHAAARDGTARAVETCPVSGRRLGSMGPATVVEIGGRTVPICCRGCAPKLRAEPDRYLAPRENPGGAPVLCVPESAVIDTGSQRIVYVECGPGLFEGRAVTLGSRRDDLYPVIEGLSPGERVAVNGVFLIDAETRLNPTTRGVPPPDAGGVVGPRPRGPDSVQ
jgi:Cu(I)/Ag(I) efflux system membrane fusion protein